MNNDQNNFDGQEENDENIHPEAFEEDIEFGDEVPDNFFDLLNNQKDLSIHYKQMVKIIARTNIIKTQNQGFRDHAQPWNFVFHQKLIFLLLQIPNKVL